MRVVNPYAGLRQQIVKNFNGQIVTNAWLKM